MRVQNKMNREYCFENSIPTNNKKTEYFLVMFFDMNDEKFAQVIITDSDIVDNERYWEIGMEENNVCKLVSHLRFDYEHVEVKRIFVCPFCKANMS